MEAKIKHSDLKYFNVISVPDEKILGTFRFLDEDEYEYEEEYEIWLPVFSESLENLWPGQLILLIVSSIGYSVILIACNWAFLLIRKWQNCYRVLDLSYATTFLHNLVQKWRSCSPPRI